MGSLTRLVAEGTSSDTITFEDEALPLGTELTVKAFLGEGGCCLEMMHRTGLEVSGAQRASVSLQPYLSGGPHCSAEVFLGEGWKCVYLPR